MIVRILQSFSVLSLFLATFISVSADAQETGGSDDSGANVGYEAGFHIGNLLPNQVPGLTEITGMGGLRGGYRVGNFVFLEGGAIRGKGHGAEYTNIDASVRIDYPFENLVAMVFLGPNLTYYKTDTRKALFYGGGHVGGGIQALIGGNVWFRSDMNFSINPGTSLYIGFGFVFRFAGGGAGG